MNKRTVVLSMAAGLLGGVASHYLTPELVHAQSKNPAPKEIRAESFVLVNEKGVVLGTLADEGGRPALKLFDEHSQEIWSAGGKIGFRTAALGR